MVWARGHRPSNHARICWEDWVATKKDDREKSLPNTNRGLCKSWHNLRSGWFCGNLDAAFFETKNLTGLGMAIRDYRGKLVMARAYTIPCCIRIRKEKPWEYIRLSRGLRISATLKLYLEQIAA